MKLHSKVEQVLADIQQRSEVTRADYLRDMDKNRSIAKRDQLSCGNLAHAFAASESGDKDNQAASRVPNLGIITAYNDMLSAHQPYGGYPGLIKILSREYGATAQVAGGVPAMCDGVTQGQPGMELSLFSRDVIAMSTAVALSHNTFDAAIMLGICDKIVPGLIIAAARFGHLPMVFLPSGPMPSGIPNADKIKARQQYAANEISKSEMLNTEMQSYHAAGTCTFYGTANSNQVLMEVMGMHMPGASFVNPGTTIRDAFNNTAIKRLVDVSREQDEMATAGQILDVPNFVNAIVGLLATGGSTNLVIHLMIMARSAGIQITLEDFSALSDVTPLIARMYPNGSADINSFHEAGGLRYVIAELLNAGLLVEDVNTIAGRGLDRYTQAPQVDENKQIQYVDEPVVSKDAEILKPADAPFDASGGLKVLTGNIGRSMIKTSALKPEQFVVEAPALVFHSQEEVKQAFKAGELKRDFVCVLRYQGVKANGMPELHALTPILGLLQDKGYKVALITDGRMSGASGKVPAAIHLSPEAMDGGGIACIKNGDVIRLDANQQQLDVLEDDFSSCEVPANETVIDQIGLGRELFDHFRRHAGASEQGGSVFFQDEADKSVDE